MGQIRVEQLPEDESRTDEIERRKQEDRQIEEDEKETERLEKTKEKSK